MRPEEKARELFWPFYDLGVSAQIAKRCALIAVHEIEKEITEYGCANDELQNMDSTFRYWDAVKIEVAKL